MFCRAKSGISFCNVTNVKKTSYYIYTVFVSFENCYCADKFLEIHTVYYLGKHFHTLKYFIQASLQ